MQIPRIYQPILLEKGQTISLDPRASHHVMTVLRLSTGDRLNLFNGQGGEFSAFISQVNGKQVAVTLGEFHEIEKESFLNTHLAQGISRGEKMDFIIQKSVELGVTRITPLITERCNVQLSSERWHKKIMHWESIIIHGCEQCGRNRLPQLLPVTQFSDFVDQVSSDSKYIFCPSAKNTLSQVSSFDKEIVLLIGPEGGFSADEIRLSKEKGFQEIRLGPRILRTETAALVALSILQSKWGDLG